MTLRRTASVVGGVLAGISALSRPAQAVPIGPDGGGPSSPRQITSVQVRSGDTLANLAAQVGRSWPALAAWNHIGNPNLIYAGETLAVPPAGWRPPPQPTPAGGVPSSPSRHVAASYSSNGWSPPWDCIAHFESGGNPTDNTGNGYWGGLQFAPPTWWEFAKKLGITVPAYEASISDQEAVADLVLRASGWGQWPNSSRRCGYR